MARDYPARSSRRQGRGERYAEGRNRAGQRTGDLHQKRSFRLFIALEIPAEAIQSLVGWQRRYLATDPALRLTPSDQLHITLVFLGQKDEKELEQAVMQMDKLKTLLSFEVEAKRLVGLPHGRSPGVMAVECTEPSGRLAAIHDELVEGLAARGLYKPEKRGFLPHVTVARTRGRSHIDLSEVHPGPFKFTAVRITLYNSILKASGALHEALKTVQLT